MKLDTPQVCLLLSSTTLAMLDTIKRKRVEFLGGWDKAVIRQGVIKKTDPVIEHIHEMEERFFAVAADLEKLCGKLSVEVMRRNGKPATKIDPENRTYLHQVAGEIIDELQHFVDTMANGHEPGFTYLDGYTDALNEMHHLMFSHNLSRQAAYDQLKEAHTKRVKIPEAA